MHVFAAEMRVSRLETRFLTTEMRISCLETRFLAPETRLSEEKSVCVLRPALASGVSALRSRVPVASRYPSSPMPLALLLGALLVGCTTGPDRPRSTAFPAAPASPTPRPSLRADAGSLLDDPRLDDRAY
jgi:hypothetical protein